MNTVRKSNLSFIIQTNGEIVPATPEAQEFSQQQIFDFVAGPPELFCRTHDGFFLFHNKDARARGLQANNLATAMYLKRTEAGKLAGRIFLAHPDHIPASWKEVAARIQDQPTGQSGTVC